MNLNFKRTVTFAPESKVIKYFIVSLIKVGFFNNK